MLNVPMSCWNWRWAVLRVPRTLDEVAVGTADRMRPENPRVVFLLGLVEGEFPSAAVPGGLFSEEERERMARGGLPFIVEGDRSAATERMFCYRAATAATVIQTIVTRLTAMPFSMPLLTPLPIQLARRIRTQRQPLPPKRSNRIKTTSFSWQKTKSLPDLSLLVRTISL